MTKFCNAMILQFKKIKKKTEGRQKLHFTWKKQKMSGCKFFERHLFRLQVSSWSIFPLDLCRLPEVELQPWVAVTSPDCGHRGSVGGHPWRWGHRRRRKKLQGMRGALSPPQVLGVSGLHRTPLDCFQKISLPEHLGPTAKVSDWISLQRDWPSQDIKVPPHPGDWDPGLSHHHPPLLKDQSSVPSPLLYLRQTMSPSFWWET